MLNSETISLWVIFKKWLVFSSVLRGGGWFGRPLRTAHYTILGERNKSNWSTKKRSTKIILFELKKSRNKGNGSFLFLSLIYWHFGSFVSLHARVRLKIWPNHPWFCQTQLPRRTRTSHLTARVFLFHQFSFFSFNLYCILSFQKWLKKN